MNKKSKGKITVVLRPTSEQLVEWFPDNEKCWHFWEQPDKIGIGQGRLPVEDIGTNSFQYGRIFNSERELRWEGSRFWLVSETDNEGEFEVEDNESFYLKAKEKEEFKQIKCVHYLSGGIVLYSRFKEAIK